MLTKLKLYFRNVRPDQILYFLLVCELINIAYFSFFFFEHRYLPGPFIWNKNDTFMDFYNPLYWVLNEGFYSVYSSIYPPLNYYILKLFTVGINSNWVTSAFNLRENFPLPILAASIFYLGILFVVVNIGEWKKIQIGNRFLIWLVCALSVPVLFTLERGNLIFLAVLFLALYASAENQWLKAIYLGVLINIKPYFLILVIQYLNYYQFNKSALIKTFLASLTIFLVTSFAPGFSLIHFSESYLQFGKGSGITADGMLALPNTLMNLYAVKWVIVYGGAFPDLQSSYAFWFTLIKMLGYLAPIFLLLIILLRPLNDVELLLATMILITNFSISSGGYVYLCYLVLLPYFLLSNEYRKLSIFVLIIFVFPLDWFRALQLYYEANSSYLGGGLFLGKIWLTVSLGSIIRPISNFLLMALFTLHLVKKYGFLRNKTYINQ